ncbi:WD40 repeat domain-containing protein [Ktedonobacter robiniae]|uniref:Translation initiation factor beta propellor-like domain-containing protein n=1 Tax=Ktedonobacter robiniae TaxID=2778365 RepID=A0ABQ3UKN8_9CHLR|nr:hypothetical protein [Ktedonobacter robiniae]GHO53306.1 hypothetical protein KSB_17810 [Ktedonobacter robiniae]
MPEGRKSTFTFERRQIVLGLAGLMGAALTGCSFDGTNTSTLQPTPGTTSQPTTTLTSKVARGTTLYVCQKHTEQVDDIAWSPDSAYIISASNGIYSQVGKGKPSQLYVWNSRTGEPNETFSINQSSAMPAPLAWSPDGKMIAICELSDAGGNDWVSFWDTQRGNLLEHMRVDPNLNFISLPGRPTVVTWLLQETVVWRSVM